MRTDTHAHLHRCTHVIMQYTTNYCTAFLPSGSNKLKARGRCPSYIILGLRLPARVGRERGREGVVLTIPPLVMVETRPSINKEGRSPGPLCYQASCHSMNCENASSAPSHWNGCRNEWPIVRCSRKHQRDLFPLSIPSRDVAEFFCENFHSRHLLHFSLNTLWIESDNWAARTMPSLFFKNYITVPWIILMKRKNACFCNDS